MRKFLFIVVPLILISAPGCGIFGGVVKKFDQATIDQIDKSISHNNKILEVMGANLDAIGGDAAKVQMLKNDLKVMGDSEISRLAMWRIYEVSKQPPPAVTGSK